MTSDEGRGARGEGRVSGVEGEEYKKMTQQGLEQFGAYQKARQLFDLVVRDMEALKTNPLPASLSADWQRGFDLCKHRRGLWKTQPNRVRSFS